MTYFLFFLISAEKPVLRLDEIYLDGSIRRPPITEIDGSRLQEKIESAAVFNLTKLEAELTRPLKRSKAVKK
jgi:hypothetical protein